MLESLDAEAVRRWCAAGLSALRLHQREIDALNVYPVPDGDTGTNLVLTVVSAHEALAAEPDGDEAVDPGELTRLGRVLRCMARGALLGARGNSGVILAQLLQGLADALAVTPRARGRVFAGALAEAAESAYSVVAEPVEGTLLTVARGAADGAARADSDDLAAVVAAAADAAAKALALTPSQLPALARAGVVDAGGRGLVVILEALVEVVTGVAVATAPLAAVAADPGLLAVAREEGSPGYAYEVQYLLDAAADRLPVLKEALAALGDSLVVVDTGVLGTAGPTWNVHVHVNDVGAALEAGIDAGRPHQISVTRFADQELGTVLDVPAAGALPPPAPTAVAAGGVRAVLAVAPGPGLVALFAAGGARSLPGRPSTRQILAEIEASGAAQIVVLPNDPNALAVANLAAGQARRADRQVAVVPTDSPVQGLAALAVRDLERRFEDDVIAMAEAAGGCRAGEVSVAVRAAQTEAGPCRPGDALGLVDGVVRLIGADSGQLARDLLDLLLGGGGELVTVLTGASTPPALAGELRRHLGARWPGVEVALHEGGQPHPLLLIGVE